MSMYKAELLRFTIYNKKCKIPLATITIFFLEKPIFRKKIAAIGYPRFYKTTPFEEKKQGQTHLFFLV